MNVNAPDKDLPRYTSRPKSGTVIAEHSISAALEVVTIETEADLAALRPGWEALQARDPEAGVFMSWEWLSTAFHANPHRWRVFAVRSGDVCVCIFPVKYRVHWSNSQNEFQSELEAGGRLLWSEYTGFLCDPDYQERALEILAHHVAELPWSKLSLRYEPSETRARQFADAFPDDKFRTAWKEYRINKGKTDNLVSPQVPLPRDFEAYLMTCLSKSTREKVRRSFRRQLDTGELHITETTAETFDGDIEILLEFWMAKWAVTKGEKKANQVAANYRKILRTALDLDILFMPVLWRGDQPLGALGHVVSIQTREVHFIVAGRSTEDGLSNIGLILHAHSIRWAIECGFSVYDFCHGNEAFKYSFGAVDKQLKFLSVRRKPDRSDVGLLDPISTAEALHRTIEFIDSGKTHQASAACRQILFDCI